MDAATTVVDKATLLAAGFAARAAQHDRDRSFPFENFKELADAGLLALTVPAVRGGLGGGVRDAARVLGIVGHADPSTALVLSMHYLQHLAIAVNPAWPPHLADRLARETLDGVALVNALRVEPELGSPARGGLPATVARHAGDGWRISGHKIYSTGAPILKWYVVWARTDETEPRVGAFLVPAGARGVRITETWDHLGLRASGSHDVLFDDVAIPTDHAVDVRTPAQWRVAKGTQVPLHAVLIPAIYDGVARAARDWLITFLKTRAPSSLGAPLASLPRVQEVVGGIEALLAVNARLIASFAEDCDSGREIAAGEANIVKLTVTGNAIAAVEAALSLTGNHGLTRANPLERHYRDVLCARVHTPQDDSTRVAAGRLALGI
ncbi:MAG: acyl-CoA dehydrogenase family protein [Pseudomonadota bacterium]